MFVKSSASFAVLAAICVPYASAAIVSLYLPGDNDGIPLTADAIGTDKGGHTTWHVGLGTPSGTFTATSGYPTASVTVVEGATDFYALGGKGSSSESLNCAFATSTASDGVVVASCDAQIVDGSSTTIPFRDLQVTLTPVPVQVSKSSGAGSLRMSLGGVAVSALAIAGTAGAMLVRA